MDALAFGRGSSAAAKEVTESQERFFGGGPKAERMSNIGSPGLHVFTSPCICESAGARVHLVHTFMRLILVHAKSQRCTGVAELYRLSDMPVMDEIVRDFKVAPSSFSL